MNMLDINPLPFANDIDGTPLNQGYVYIGQAGLDPQLYPQTVYWDSNGVFPAPQPLRTLNGRIYNAGAPSPIFISGDYSERVLNRNGAQVSLLLNVNTLAGASGSSMVGFIAAGAGAVGRTVQDVLRDVANFDVKNFNAKGDGVTDDTAAINACILAAGLAGGATVYFPPGTYLVLGTLTAAAAGVRWMGAGRAATTLKFNTGAADCIQFNGSSGSYLTGVGIQEMSIDCTGKTGGRLIASQFIHRAIFQRLTFFNPYAGIELYCSQDASFHDVIMEGCTGGAGANFNTFGPVGQKPPRAFAMFWHAPGDGTGRADVLSLNDLTFDCGYSGGDGFILDGQVNTLNIRSATPLRARRGWWIRNTAASATYYPALIEAFNINADGMSETGMLIDAGSSMRFHAAELANNSGSAGQGSADTNALIINPDTGASETRDIEFIGGRVGLSKQTAAKQGGKNVSFIGTTFEAGATTPANTYAAIEILATAAATRLIGCMSELFGSPNNWKYGLQVNDGATRTIEVGNDWALSGTGGVLRNDSDAQSRSGLNIDSSPNTVDPAPTTFPTAVDGAAPPATLSVPNILGGVLISSGAGGAISTATPTAAAIVAGMQSPQISKTSPLKVINGNGFNWTLTPGVGVTFTGILAGGNFVLATQTKLDLQIRINTTTAGAESVTIFG